MSYIKTLKTSLHRNPQKLTLRWVPKNIFGHIVAYASCFRDWQVGTNRRSHSSNLFLFLEFQRLQMKRSPVNKDHTRTQSKQHIWMYFGYISTHEGDMAAATRYTHYVDVVAHAATVVHSSSPLHRILVCNLFSAPSTDTTSRSHAQMSRYTDAYGMMTIARCIQKRNQNTTVYHMLVVVVGIARER